MNRRRFLRFLKTTGLGSGSLFLPSRLLLLAPSAALMPLMAAPTTSSAAVFGLASAYDLKDKPEMRDRTLRVLAHIARQQADVESGAKSVADAAAEIRDTIEREGKHQSKAANT